MVHLGLGSSKRSEYTLPEYRLQCATRPIQPSTTCTTLNLSMRTGSLGAPSQSLITGYGLGAPTADHHPGAATTGRRSTATIPGRPEAIVARNPKTSTPSGPVLSLGITVISPAPALLRTAPNLFTILGVLSIPSVVHVLTASQENADLTLGFQSHSYQLSHSTRGPHYHYHCTTHYPHHYNHGEVQVVGQGKRPSGAVILVFPTVDWTGNPKVRPVADAGNRKRKVRFAEDAGHHKVRSTEDVVHRKVRFAEDPVHRKVRFAEPVRRKVRFAEDPVRRKVRFVDDLLEESSSSQLGNVEPWQSHSR